MEQRSAVSNGVTGHYRKNAHQWTKGTTAPGRLRGAVLGVALGLLGLAQLIVPTAAVAQASTQPRVQSLEFRVGSATDTTNQTEEAIVDVTVILTLDRVAPVSLQYRINTANRSPGFTLNQDYEFPLPATLTVKPGDRTGTYTFRILDDKVDEERESVRICAIRVDGRFGSCRVFTVIDNDTFGIRDIVATPARVPEAGGQVVDVRVRYNASVLTQRSERIVFSGTARPGVDFTGGPQQLVVRPGALETRFQLAIRDDGLREDPETITIGIGAKTETITIIDGTEAALLDDVRRQAGAALLRRGAGRFARLTNNVVIKRLAGESANVVSPEGRSALVDLGATVASLTSRRSPQDRAAAPGGPANVWVSSEATRLSGDVDGEVFDVHIGADVKLSRDALVGVVVSYETADVDTAIHDGGLKADGWSLGAYAGVKLTPSLTWDVAGSYGRHASDVFARSGAQAFTGDYDSKRFLVASHLTGAVGIGDGVVVKPTVGVLYGRVKQGTLTTRQGNRTGERQLELGRLSAGPRIEYAPALPGGWGRLELTASATGQYDLLAPERAADRLDRLSAALALGLSWTDRAGTSVAVDSSIDGLGLKGYDAYNVSGKLTFEF